MVWKRGVCERWGCTLIETYQFEHTAGRLDRAVLARVRAAGVTTSPRDPDVVLRELDHRIRIREPLRDRLGSFIDLARSTRRPPEAIRAHTRGASRLVRLFTEVGLEALAIYEGRLEQRGEIDFTDMIDWADRLIDEGRASPRYDHVLVDEFQDINPAEFALIEGLVDAADAHLFVVGDDWQSITSFRGAMIGQIIGFDDAHEGVATTPLGRSYRLPDTVAAAGASLIAQNTAQLDKRVDPIRGVAGRIRVHEIAAEGPLYRDLLVERTTALIERTLAAEDTGAPGAIMVLCRYDSAVSTLDAIRGKLRAMGIDYTDISELSDARMHPVLIGTVHSAKGMEADRVIIVDVGEGRMGFPPTDRRRDLLMGVMPEPERWAADDGGEATGHPAIEEERRLFYVALTRARSSVDILAPRTRPSRFIAEIEEHVGRVAATHGIAAIDPEGTPLPLLVRVREHERAPHPTIDQRGVLEDGGGTVAFISWRSDPVGPLTEGTWYRISGHRTDTFRDRPQVVLDADTEVLELDAIPEDVEPASIEPCEVSHGTSDIADLLWTMGAGGAVDQWATAPDIDLVRRLAVRTEEELSSELEITGADAELLGTAARAHTGVVPTVIDEIVATTGASKQVVLDRFMTEACAGASAPDMRAALLKRFEANA
jgi:DNA helicase-4